MSSADDFLNQYQTPSSGSADSFLSAYANPQSQVSGTQSFVDKAADTMSFGANHPVWSAVDAATKAALGQGKFGDLYDAEMAKQKSIETAESSEHPYASAGGIAAGFAGSLVPAFMTGGAAQGPAAASWLSTLGTASRNNAVIGAGIGEANAVANTPGGWDQKLGAVPQAGLAGGAIGAVVPVAASGIGAVAKSPLSMIKYFSTSDGDKAMQAIARALGKDSITPAQAADVVGQLGANTALSDIGGENTNNLLRSVVNRGGPGANTITNTLLGRNLGLGGRMQDLTTGAFGTDAEFNNTAANLEAGMSERASPLYQAANAANKSMTSPELDRIVSTPAGAAALKDASTRMLNRRTWMGVPDPDLAEQAKLTNSYQPGGIPNGLKLSAWDYVKKSLDAQASSAYRAGDNDAGSAASGLAANLRGELDKLDSTNKYNLGYVDGRLRQVPQPGTGLYAQARAAYGGPAASKDALESGRAFMSEDPQVTAQQISQLPDSDKKMFQIGAARAVSDKIGANPSSALTQIMGNDLYRQKLQAAMPAQNDYLNFIMGMQNEAAKRASTKEILGNSTTAKQLASMTENQGESPFNVGNAIDLMNGDLKGTAFQGAKWAYNRMTAPRPAVGAEIARRMVNPQMASPTISSLAPYMAPGGVPHMTIAPWAKLLGYQGAAFLNGGQ